MVEPGVYLEKLSWFSRLLREEGLTVGTQETIDAGKILVSLGFEDREQVKTALRTVYAKSREEQNLFDRVFDGFFLSEERMRQLAKEHLEQQQREQQIQEQAREDLEVNGKPMELTEEQRSIYMTMPEEARESCAGSGRPSRTRRNGAPSCTTTSSNRFL